MQQARFGRTSTCDRKVVSSLPENNRNLARQQTYQDKTTVLVMLVCSDSSGRAMPPTATTEKLVLVYSAVAMRQPTGNAIIRNRTEYEASTDVASRPARHYEDFDP